MPVIWMEVVRDFLNGDWDCWGNEVGKFNNFDLLEALE